MRYVPAISLLLFVPLASAQAPGGSSLLTQLGKQLRQLRAMPMSAPTNASCPDNKNSFVGMSQLVIQKKLGAPDLVEVRSSSGGSYFFTNPVHLTGASHLVDAQSYSWSYFFTSPVPIDQIGGGFPQLTFKFSKDKRVVGVTCYYAR